MPMQEKGTWISAELLLREASRREEEVLFGNPSPDRIVEMEELETEATLELMDAVPLPTGQRHSGGLDRFLTNDIKYRRTNSEPTIEGFPTPRPINPK